MEREARCLPSEGQPRGIRSQAPYGVFESGEAVGIVSGIGGKCAADAAFWGIREFQPELVISAGFAGALRAEVEVGSCVRPEWVIDSETQERFPGGGSEGVLVTAPAIAGIHHKHALASRYSACAVDMEAAAVARAAREQGIRFAAVKAISDGIGTNLPPLDRFIDPKGRFEEVRFVTWAAIRPWSWPALFELARGTRAANLELGRAVRNLLQQELPGRGERLSSSAAITTNR